MQYSVAVALLPFDRKAESSTTRHQHRIPPNNISLHTHLPFHHHPSQSFPLGTFKQPALTSDQTPAQHGNSFLSPLFLSTILPDRDQIQQCLHALSHHGVFHWQFLHVFPTTCPLRAHRRNTQSLLPTLISPSTQLTPLNPTQTRSSQHKSVQNQPTKLALSGQLYSQFSPQQEPSQLHALCHRTKLALSSTINPTPNTHSYRRTLTPHNAANSALSLSQKSVATCLCSKRQVSFSHASSTVTAQRRTRPNAQDSKTLFPAQITPCSSHHSHNTENRSSFPGKTRTRRKPQQLLKNTRFPAQKPSVSQQTLSTHEIAHLCRLSPM